MKAILQIVFAAGLPLLSLSADSASDAPGVLLCGLKPGAPVLKTVSEAGWSGVENFDGKISVLAGNAAVFVFDAPPAVSQCGIGEYVKSGGVLLISASRSEVGFFEAWNAFFATNGISELKLALRENEVPLIKYSNWNELILMNHPDKIGPIVNGVKKRLLRVERPPKNIRPWRSEGMLQGKAYRDNGEHVLLSCGLGRGLIFVSTLPFESEPALAEKLFFNIRSRIAARRRGAELLSAGISFNDTNIPFGDGGVSARVHNFGDTGIVARVYVECEDAAAQRRVIWGETAIKAGASADIRCNGRIDLFGKCTGRISLSVDGGEKVEQLVWSYAAPERLELLMPVYRASVSAARREKDVRLGLKFNDGAGDGELHTAAIGLYAPDGKKLVSTNIQVSGSAVNRFTLPLSADAPAGKYRVEASVRRRSERLFDKDFFEVVPVVPGQVIPDQDGVLLADGKPFFPLGFYHVRLEELEAVAKTGANFIQYWYWNTTATNAAAGFELMERHGIRYVFEGFAWHETVNRQVSERGLSANLPWRGRLPLNYELSSSYRTMVKNALAEPRKRLAMWYSADEAGASQLPEVFRIADYYRKIDPNHPTYTVSTSDPKVGEGADIVGFDYYNRSKLCRSNAVFGDIIDNARSFYGCGKCIFAVPQSFGDDINHPAETPQSIRSTAYLVLAHGVNGIIWYSWNESGSRRGIEGAANHADTAAAITKLISEIKSITPALTSGVFKPLRSKDGLIHAAVIGNGESGRYLIYSNAEELLSDTELALPGEEKVRLRRLSGEAEIAEKGGGRFGFRAPPLDGGVFALE